MRNVAIVFSILLAADSLFVAILNSGKVVDLTYNMSNSNMQFSLAMLISLAFFLGTLTAFSMSYYSMRNIIFKIKEYEKAEKLK